MVYTVTDDKTGRSYTVNANHNSEIEIVWLSQKYWFSAGDSVTITGEDGTSKTFIK